MSTLTKDSITLEPELHGIIKVEIESLEKGLVILKHEFQCGDKGTADFLCVDSGGRLGIIEVKVDEDKDILFQALRYYEWVDNNRFVIKTMFPKQKINPEEHPRIILIEGAVSDDLRRLSNLVTPDVELFEYTVLKTKDGSRGICFHPVSLPKPPEVPPKPQTIEDILNYITDDSLRKLCKKVMKKIKEIGEGIEAPFTTQEYIGYKYKGRLFGYLSKHRQSFDICWPELDEKNRVLKYDFVRIESPDEDYTDAMNKVKDAFIRLGGTLKE